MILDQIVGRSEHESCLPSMGPMDAYWEQSAEEPPTLVPDHTVIQEDGDTTTSISVPNSLAGAIIGKAGIRIKRVRQESGATITIDNPTGHNGKERLITIKGTAKQVRYAYTLLQNR